MSPCALGTNTVIKYVYIKKKKYIASYILTVLHIITFV